MTPKPYLRKPGLVYALQLNFEGEIETEAGIFKHKPGDWLMKTPDKMWICEESEFDKLYEPMPTAAEIRERVKEELRNEHQSTQ